MKSWTFWRWTLGVNLAVALSGQASWADSVNPSTGSSAPAEASARGDQTNATPAGLAQDIANAPATVVTGEKPAPLDVHLSGPASELVKLANSGVDQAVMLAFVTNSASVFDLNADRLIYLRDVGIPSAVLTAMMEHDQVLKTSAPALAPSPAPVVTASAPQPESPPPAQSVAPQLEANAAPPPAQPVAEAYPTFYGALAPYGTWIYVSGYGYCWQPGVVACDPGWRPYFDCGHWVYTDCGWYWTSDYSWGWAPFHYGRWFRHARFGWCWAPDTVWGPSWVSWRYSDDYCGWAPLPPAACFEPAVGLTWCGGPVAVGFEFGLGWDCFAFVGWHHFHDYHLRGCDLPRERVTQVFNNTVVVNHIVNNHTTIINEGPPRERVVAATHAPLRPVALRDVNRPERSGRAMGLTGRSLGVYRPAVAAHTATTVAVASRAEASRWQSGGSAAGAHLGARPALASRFAEPSRSQGPHPVLSSAPPAVNKTVPTRTERFGAPARPGSGGPLQQRAQPSALAASPNQKSAPALAAPPVYRSAESRPSPALARNASAPAPVSHSETKPAQRTSLAASTATPAAAHSVPRSGTATQVTEPLHRWTYAPEPRSRPEPGSAPRTYSTAAPEAYKAPAQPSYSATTRYEPQRSYAPQGGSLASPHASTSSARPSYSPAPQRYAAPAPQAYPSAPRYEPGPAYAPSARAYTPAPANSGYASVPRYRSEPAYAPLRSYAPAPGAWGSSSGYSPSYSPAPHYSVGPAMSATAHGGEFRGAPSGGSSGSWSDHNGHGGR